MSAEIRPLAFPLLGAAAPVCEGDVCIVPGLDDAATPSHPTTRGSDALTR